MKVAIISDTHDNIPNLEKFLDWANKNDMAMIVHCGDISSVATVALMAEKFFGQINLVFGNASDRDGINSMSIKLNNVKVHGDQGEIFTAGKKIAFCHKPEEAKILAAGGQHQIVFYGHTHKPWIESVGNCQLVNPGTLGGMFQKATFAVYDTKSSNLELKVLETIT